MLDLITWEEFTAMGGKASESAFNRWVMRAEGIIDNATRGRLVYFDSIPNQAKALARELIDLFDQSEQAGNVASRSQSAGAVSESVSYEKNDSSEEKEHISALIYDYLFSIKKDGVSVLYEGADFPC